MANKTTLNEAKYEVEALNEFEGSSIFAKDMSDALYVVYSYGYHFPMYVFDRAIRKWIGNSSKYSTTTSKHQSKCRPNNVSYWLDTGELNLLIQKDGFVQYKTREVV